MKRVTCPICGIKFKFAGVFVCPNRAAHPKKPKPLVVLPNQETGGVEFVPMVSP